ncbi:MULTISPECIES: hypothetical protein [unclassified Sphingobium]
MIRPWEQEGGNALPRWHHWLIAAGTLFLMGLIVPLFAAFI